MPAPDSIALPPTPRWKIFLAGLLIVLAGLAAYANSFHGQFFLDDLPAITENPTIQQDWAAALHPPGEGQTVTNRPLVNLSLAANFKYAQKNSGNGFALPGYHALNITVHLLAGLALFGLVRRTLELPKLRGRFGGDALLLAFMAALLWTVHPLQTGSVTYIVQRAESMMGMFFLIMFYCYARGVGSRPWLWWPLAAAAMLASGLCKEVAVTAPVMVLAYDWIFVARTPKEILRRRWPVHVGLLLVAGIIVYRAYLAGTRGLSAGFGTGVFWYDYALSQFPAILNYLKLTVWPHPLTLDYGQELVQTVGAALPAMLVIMTLVAGTAYALWRRPGLGFLGVWFFVILAPSSSVVPIVTETSVEHRMYLPLAALTVLGALGLWKYFGRRALPAALLITLALGTSTAARNRDYNSRAGLWADATAKQPAIARTHENYGIMLYDANRLRESVQEFTAAIRLKPIYPDCENNLGNAYSGLGQFDEAVSHYLRAAQNLLRATDQAKALNNAGNAYISLNQPQLAFNAFKRATELAPGFAAAYNNLGTILFQAGQFDDSLRAYQLALQAQPVFPQVLTNIGNVFVRAGQVERALPYYGQALEQDPGNGEPRFRLANALAVLNRFDEAEKLYAAVEVLAPNYTDAHYNRGVCLVNLGRLTEAAAEYEATLVLDPKYEAARTALAGLRGPAASPHP